MTDTPSPLTAALMGDLLQTHPAVGMFLAGAGLPPPDPRLTLADWLAGLDDETATDAGISRDQLLAHIGALAGSAAVSRRAALERVETLTILGGQDKNGRGEGAELTVRAGEIVCIVGPTGSGKSRLLGDIECLAQGDTPTGRRILINGAAPDESWRSSFDRKLVAQLSQNMNFVVDLTVAEFVAMHAECRLLGEDPAVIARQAAEVIACANALTGEKFSADVSVTQLSGGQTRALMIADAALLSASPVVLIDEIENAGVDRKRALELLVAEDKIVFISTHDPLLALRGGRRIVIRNGGVSDVIVTGPDEQAALQELELLDARLMNIRDRLRRGERITSSSGVSS